MNIFRLLADPLHVGAILMLLIKICMGKSCSGVSARTQILFALVFSARYMDLFTNFVSYYNTTMKILILLLTYITIGLIFTKLKETYDSKYDTFRIELLIIPAGLLAFFVNHEFTFMEVLWTFSIYLESVAILPQLLMLIKSGESESMIWHYVFALGLYRAIYIVNWIYRYYYEGCYDTIAICAGCVQTLLFGHFFYIYIRKSVKGEKFGDVKYNLVEGVDI